MTAETDAIGTPDENPGVPMCLIPQVALQAVHDWLNSDKQTMPQNEVRAAMNLLMSAKLVTDKTGASDTDTEDDKGDEPTGPRLVDDPASTDTESEEVNNG